MVANMTDVTSNGPAVEPVSTRTFIAYFVWVTVVAGGSYTVYGLVDGFVEPFKSGEASLFICLLIFVAIGEAFIGLIESKSIRSALYAWPSMVVAIFGIVVNGYFVYENRRHGGTSLEWLEIVALYAGATYAAAARFAFVLSWTDWIDMSDRYVTYMSNLGKPKDGAAIQDGSQSSVG
jgi:hypothetical protein